MIITVLHLFYRSYICFQSWFYLPHHLFNISYKPFWIAGFVSHKPYPNPLNYWQMPPHIGAIEEIECEPMIFTLQLLGMQMLHWSAGLQLLGAECCLQYHSSPKMPNDLVDRSSQGGL